MDFSTVDPIEFVMDATRGFGADCGVDAVGFQAHDAAGNEHPELVLDNLIKTVRETGHIGVVGVYVPEDPGAATEPAKKGRIESTTARRSRKHQRRLRPGPGEEVHCG